MDYENIEIIDFKIASTDFKLRMKELLHILYNSIVLVFITTGTKFRGFIQIRLFYKQSLLRLTEKFWPKLNYYVR